MTTRHALRSGEMLAISLDAIQRDAAGFFLLMGPESPDNEVVGSAIVVHVRGALAHFKGGGGDSYEGIVERVGDALACEPSHVVLRIESPGGLVAGCFESVLKLRRMSAEVGIPLIAYIDETAGSAAYAVCCACEEVLAPPASVSGSVGVVSTIGSQSKRNAKDGIDVVLITSGARKADGNPNGPIEDAAVEAERGRVEEMAAQFFALVSDARGVSPKKIAALEAAVYLGKTSKIDDARDVGLVDEVISFDAAMAYLDTGKKPLDKAAHLASPSTAHDGPKCAADLEGNMSVKLQAIVAKMATETDPVKITALLAEYGLAVPRAGGDPEDKGDKGDRGDDGEDGEDGEDKAKKAAAATKKAQGKADAAKHRAKAAEHKARAAESEEEAKKCEADDDEPAAAAAAVLRAAGTSDAAASAIAEQARISGDAVARITALEAGLAKREQAATIKEALADGRVTPAEAKMLGGKTPAWSAEYIDTRKGVRVVNVEEGTLIRPRDAGTPTDNEASEVNGRIAAMGVTDPKLVEKLRADMLTNRRKAEANGAGPGRY